MIKHSYFNGDIVPEVWCDVCGTIVRDGHFAEVIFEDGKDSDPINVMVGHTQCTSNYEDDHPQFTNNISLALYFEKLTGAK